MGQVTEELDEDSRSFRTSSKIRSPLLSQVTTNTNTTMKKNIYEEDEDGLIEIIKILAIAAVFFTATFIAFSLIL